MCLLHYLLLRLLCLLGLSNRLWLLWPLRGLSSLLNRLSRGLGLLSSSDNVGFLNNLFEYGVYTIKVHLSLANTSNFHSSVKMPNAA